MSRIARAPLVAPDQLLSRLDDPQLRLADVRWYLSDPERGRTEYEQGHIPGAVFVDLDHDLAAPRDRVAIPSPTH